MKQKKKYQCFGNKEELKMARLDSLSIELQGQVGKDKCAEEYGKVIENIQEISLADVLKNTDLSGDITAGTVEAKRFSNVTGQTYGTARANGAGNKLKAKPVTISIDDDVEYIEEVEEKDLMTYGVNGLIERRAKNHQDTFAIDKDVKFFAEAVKEGTAFVPTQRANGNSIEDDVEEAIASLQATRNEYVNGVPRNLIAVIMTPKKYGELRNKINAIPNSNGNGQLANYEQGTFNNTAIFSSVFLPEGIDYIVMVYGQNGAVAQPTRANIYSPAKIPLSEATAFGLFTYKGTKVVASDLIKYVGNSTASL